MNNQTKLAIPPGLAISLGHLAAIFSLLFILILILLTLFFLFTKQKNNSVFDEHELPSRFSTSTSERKSFQFRRPKQYSSTNNNQLSLSAHSFQMDIDEHQTRSTVNLLSSK